MERLVSTPRANWRERCEAVGFDFHSLDGAYWNEAACYRFSAAEVDRIEAAAAELHALCLNLVADTVRSGDYAAFRLPTAAAALIERSWRAQEPSLYGRFDFAYDGRDLKLLEYNADTPTALLETAVVQWHWLEDMGLPDQFNSLHERLIGRWAELRESLAADATVHFAAAHGATSEDWVNLHYLLDTALQAGLHTASLDIESLGWNGRHFVDAHDEPVWTCFKLYPWEWLLAEEFGAHIPATAIRFIEPPWKMLLSTKALLPALWQRHPGHPLLLPAWFEDAAPPQAAAGTWARKPMLSREGANVSRIADGRRALAAGSHEMPLYDRDYVLQQWFELPDLDGFHPVIGAWIVGAEPAGMGIREDRAAVTGNASRFVPHYFDH